MSRLIVILIVSAIGALVTGHALAGIWIIVACLILSTIAGARHIAQPGPKPASGGIGARTRIHGAEKFDPNAPAKQLMPNDECVVTVPANNRYDHPQTDTTMLSGDSLFPD